MEGTVERHLIQCLVKEAVERGLNQTCASVDDCDVVAEGFGLIQQVGREQDRDPVVAERADDVVDEGAAPRVETGGGLIEDDHARAANERARQAHALLLAPGQAPNRGAAERVDAELTNPPIRGVRSAAQRGHVTHELRSSGPRRQALFLEHHVKIPPSREAPRRTPQDVHAAGLRRAQAREDRDRGRLPGPIGPQEPGDPALGYRERESVQAPPPPIGQRHLVQSRGEHLRSLGAGFALPDNSDTLGV